MSSKKKKFKVRMSTQKKEKNTCSLSRICSMKKKNWSVEAIHGRDEKMNNKWYQEIDCESQTKIFVDAKVENKNIDGTDEYKFFLEFTIDKKLRLRKQKLQ